MLDQLEKKVQYGLLHMSGILRLIVKGAFLPKKVAATIYIY